MTTTSVDKIVSQHQGEQGGLITMLEAIQAEYGYLPEDVLRELADKTGLSLVDIYGVATFYKAFSLKPRGKHLVSCCLGTACHVRGAPNVAAKLEDRLGVPPGETTADKEFTLETVACLGACALGPIVVIDGHYFSNVRQAEVDNILTKAQRGLDKVEVSTDERVFPINVSCPRCNRGLLDTENLVEDHPSIRLTFSYGRKHGSMRMSSLYGSFTVQSDHAIPDGTDLNLFCPHCHAELASPSACPACNAQLVPLMVRGGGVLQFCSRRGCKEHRLDFGGVNL